MDGCRIPFNRPFVTGTEFRFVQEAIDAGHLSGNGEFTRRCHQWLERETGSRKALLTHSCTGALEMAAILADVRPGDEIIMPSYTFVSTANAFVLRGGVPVFVDIRPDTLNIDERLIEDAITPRTKALCVVHYAGIACEMDSISEIARNRRLLLIEDAAQGLLSSYQGRSLGSMGHLGALSFHETKNVICGEGGALLVNDDRLVARAEIIWEKGTNRSAFFRGQIDKYTWVDIGSSFLPGEIVAAFLWAQLLEAKAITERRLALWKVYFEGFRQAEIQGLLRRPIVPVGQQHTAHMFYILVESITMRRRVLDRLRSEGYLAVFHYVPLHSSPAGQHYGRVASSMQHTDDVAQRLIRLPLWIDLPPDTALQIVDTVVDELRR